MPHLKLATVEDIPDIERMALLFHSSSPYRSVPADPGFVRAHIRHVLSLPSDKAIIILTEDNTGMVVGIQTECIFNGWKQAGELLFWVDPGSRKSAAAKELKAAYEYWAKHIAGCRLISLTALDDELYPVIDHFYRRSGYSLTEHQYLKEI